MIIHLIMIFIWLVILFYVGLQLSKWLRLNKLKKRWRLKIAQQFTVQPSKQAVGRRVKRSKKE